MDMNWPSLFRYDAWANDLTLSSIRDQGDSGEEARKLYAHVLAAQLIWYSRLVQQPAAVEVWPAMAISDMEKINRELPEKWSSFLAKHDGRLDQSCRYRNTEGKEFETSATEILMHVALHSSYHRGQVARSLRRLDLVPAVTDFIAFTRR